MVAIIMAITTLCTLVMVPLCAGLFGLFAFGAPAAGIAVVLTYLIPGIPNASELFQMVITWIGNLF